MSDIKTFTFSNPAGSVFRKCRFQKRDKTEENEINPFAHTVKPVLYQIRKRESQKILTSILIYPRGNEFYAVAMINNPILKSWGSDGFKETAELAAISALTEAGYKILIKDLADTPTIEELLSEMAIFYNTANTTIYKED